MDGNLDRKAMNRTLRQNLPHALQRLRGEPYWPNLFAYAGAGPETEALEWLKEVKQRGAPP
jgi:hypothetical protein